MDSKALYQTAYDLHYSKSAFDEALRKYKELIEKFPESKEAGYAKSQISNIENMREIEKKRKSEQITTTQIASESESENNPTKLKKEERAKVIESNAAKNDRFKTLLSYGQFMSGFGWFLIIVSIITIIIAFAGDRGVAGIIIIGGVLGILFGLMFVINGQVTSCFVSIEKNTRITNEWLKMNSVE